MGKTENGKQKKMAYNMGARAKFIRTKKLAKGSPTLSAETAERMGHPEAFYGSRGWGLQHES